jgi:hypothetical protein
MPRAPRSFLALAVILLACEARAQVPQCSQLPVLFIVQDVSGSMAGTPTGVAGGPTKWESAQMVVPQVAASFANRFRYGAMFFPSAASTCSSGTVLLNVGATATEVNTLYQSSNVAGGTPSAGSLDAARTYLLGRGLSTPAHVLFITDGLPNCNAALNVSTCTRIDSAAAGSLTNCLDDQGTVAAAGRLFAAGIKVFVVGFGNGVTSAGNAALLNSVAQAGGTTSAYFATSQAALQMALSQVASQATTCCTNLCINGAAQCNSSGQRQVCQIDRAIGCTAWVTQACASMTQCQNGACVACNNVCTPGATRCDGSNAERCVQDANGCSKWEVADRCTYGELCTSGACVSCAPCLIGSSRCTATGVETCQGNILTGCSQWVASTCAAGSVCTSGRCASCTGTCTSGTRRCVGKDVETCAADTRGCTAWQPTQTCSTFCSGGACGVCGTSCALGTQRCNGNGVEQCIRDANNCTVWSNATACAVDEFCQGQACARCPNGCTPGSKRCGVSTGSVEECKTTAMGCPAWQVAEPCDVPAGERCLNGACVPPCQNQCTVGEGRCVGGAPQVCETGPSGCSVWQARSACASAEVCTAGVCRGRCQPGEFETCAAGLACVGLPEGRLCLPRLPDGGVQVGPDLVVDGGTGIEPGTGGSTGGTGGMAGVRPGAGGARETVGGRTGCGCSGATVEVLLMPLGLLVYRRRRLAFVHGRG